MGSVAQAVLEFDEAVQVPWRPPLGGAAAPAGRPAVLHAVPSTPHRRPHAARVARLTTPEPSRMRQPARPSGVRAAGADGVPTGATALGHTCVHCSKGAGHQSAPVRLTRRARRLVAVVGVAIGVLAGVWVGSVVAGGDEGLVLVSDSSVVVREGDTLWSIARSVAGEEDVRAVVDAIQQLNDLKDATLLPGQVLRLP